MSTAPSSTTSTARSTRTAIEWGPAGHHPENHPHHPGSREALAASFDLRDRSGERPDDN